MKKKVKLDWKGFLNKRENVAITAVALVFCVGVAITNAKSGDIPLHDGDVLVDSRNVAQAEYAPQETEEDAPAKPDDTDTAAENAGETEGTEKGAEADDAKDSFAEKRAALELERNDLIAQYDDIIKNSTNEAEKKNAVAQKKKLSGYMEQEIAVQGKILAKDLPQSFVIIAESAVTVTVDEQDLQQNTVAKICHIVMAETKRSAEDIIIQSRY